MSAHASAAVDHLLSTRARLAPPPATRPVADPQYDFGAGQPDPGSFPYDDLVEATRKVMKAEGAAALMYGEAQGYRPLRELVCHKYELYEGLKVEPDNILVANGSGHALALAFSAFVDVGDPIIIEAPTFSGTLHSIRRHGPEVVGVPVDADGMVTDAVRERLERLRRQGRHCKLIYTIVNFQNPAGPCLSLRRRHELVELAHRYDTIILEDDAYHELRFEGDVQPPVYSLDGGGRVIRAGTLSKILGAGVRLGWLCAPRPLVPVLQTFLYGGGVSPYMSRVATYYMREHMAEHVAVLVDVYRTKRDAMLKGLWEVLGGTDVEISRPQGGFFIWIRLPSGTDPARLLELTSRARIQVSQGPSFFFDGSGREFIRLAYSYEPPERCYEGACLVAQAIRDARG
jgi:2-aminoadipate transaminase